MFQFQRICEPFHRSILHHILRIAQIVVQAFEPDRYVNGTTHVQIFEIEAQHIRFAVRLIRHLAAEKTDHDLLIIRIVLDFSYGYMICGKGNQVVFNRVRSSCKTRRCRKNKAAALGRCILIERKIHRVRFYEFHFRICFVFAGGFVKMRKVRCLVNSVDLVNWEEIMRDRDIAVRVIFDLRDVNWSFPQLACQLILILVRLDSAR